MVKTEFMVVVAGEAFFAEHDFEVIELLIEMSDGPESGDYSVFTRTVETTYSKFSDKSAEFKGRWFKRG